MKTKKTPEPKRLFRSNKDKVVAGVCGGIGNYFGIDPVWIRIVFVFLFLIHGTGLILYAIAWILVPKNPTGKEAAPTQAEKFVADVAKKSPSKDKKFLLGGVLIAIGGLILFDNVFGWISHKLLWPGILIIAGIYLIHSRSK